MYRVNNISRDKKNHRAWSRFMVFYRFFYFFYFSVRLLSVFYWWNKQ